MAAAHPWCARGRWCGPPARQRRSGQSLIESCLVIAIVCLLFFGIFQVSQLYAASEVLHYAAGRGVRAKTVGFNKFMVYKTVRVGAIPNAGRLVNPAYSGGPAAASALELPRMSLYLGARWFGALPAILEYENWDTVQYAQPGVQLDGNLHVTIDQHYPLTAPFHRAFYAADTVELSGDAQIENHYPLYLDDADL